jgi:hypothetical protein
MEVQTRSVLVAIEQHHYQTPRARWKAHYSRLRAFHHRNDGRADAWKLVLLGLAAFWSAVAYGIYILA